jgi:Tfp pilus assembly protein PilV
LPEAFDKEVWIALLLVIMGVFSIVALELTALKEEEH